MFPDAKKPLTIFDLEDLSEENFCIVTKINQE
jgi:hypothetical protein